MSKCEVSAVGSLNPPTEVTKEKSSRDNREPTSKDGKMAKMEDSRSSGTQASAENTSTLGTQAPAGNTPIEGTQAPAGNTPIEGTQAPEGNTPTLGTQAPEGNTSNLGTQAQAGNTSTLGTQASAGNTPTLGTQAPLGNTSTLGTQAPAGNTPTLGTQAPAGNTSTEGTLPVVPDFQESHENTSNINVNHPAAVKNCYEKEINNLSTPSSPVGSGGETGNKKSEYQGPKQKNIPHNEHSAEARSTSQTEHSAESRNTSHTSHSAEEIREVEQDEIAAEKAKFKDKEDKKDLGNQIDDRERIRGNLEETDNQNNEERESGSVDNNNEIRVNSDASDEENFDAGREPERRESEPEPRVGDLPLRPTRIKKRIQLVCKCLAVFAALTFLTMTTYPIFVCELFTLDKHSSEPASVQYHKNYIQCQQDTMSFIHQSKQKMKFDIKYKLLTLVCLHTPDLEMSPRDDRPCDDLDDLEDFIIDKGLPLLATRSGDHFLPDVLTLILDIFREIRIHLWSMLWDESMEDIEKDTKEDVKEDNIDKHDSENTEIQGKTLVTNIWDQISSYFQMAKVSKKDAAEFEQEVQRSLQYKKWNGKSRQATYERVKSEKLDEFFTAMSKAYGWAEEFEEQVKVGGLFAEKWQQKILDVKISSTSGDTNDLRYGMIGMSKWPDSDDCAIAYVEYGVEFEFAEQEVTKRIDVQEKGILFNTMVQKVVTEYQTPKLDDQQIDRLTNYFRYKALKSFQNEGFIRGPINDENDIKDVPQNIDMEE